MFEARPLVWLVSHYSGTLRGLSKVIWLLALFPDVGSCTMVCGIPCVLCEAMQTFVSTNPGGVDGDVDEAGLVDVEYDCSGVLGVPGLIGGLG